MNSRIDLFLTACVAAGLLLQPSSVAAEDWPQWRGPGRNGLSAESGLLKEWPANGPKLQWHLEDIGFGYSTPSVKGDRLYVMSNEGADDEFVLALSTADGRQLWRTRVGKVGPNDERMNFPGARSTPTVAGDHVVVLGSDGDLACLDAATGRILWAKNLRTEFGGQPGAWAYAESPLVDADVIVCTPGGAEATIVALNRNSGEVLWKCATPEGDQAGYSSVIVSDAGGVKQYVQFLQKALVGVEAGSGRLLWSYDRTARNSPANIPTPVAKGDLIYSGANRSGGGLIRVQRDGDAFRVEQVYFAPKLPTQIGGAVLVGDHLYGTTGSALLCVEFATGEVKWEESSVGAASVLHADGHLYLHTERDGELLLVEASPQAYRQKGRFTPEGTPADRGRSRAWTHPTLADGRLYIRDLGKLWCYDVRAR